VEVVPRRFWQLPTRMTSSGFDSGSLWMQWDSLGFLEKKISDYWSCPQDGTLPNPIPLSLPWKLCMQAYVNHFSHLNILYNDWNFYEALYFLKTGSQWHITATFSSLVIVFFFSLPLWAYVSTRHKEIYIFKEKHHSHVNSKFPWVISKCGAQSAVNLNVRGGPISTYPSSGNRNISCFTV